MTSAGAQKAIAIPGLGSVTEGSREAALLGPLLGMAVGDALGTTYEFARIDQPDYPTLATAPATDVVGGGPFELKPGQITDDTQMAICIARSLVKARPLDLADLAERYVAWFQHAFDVGNQTASALKAIESGVSVTHAGRQVWHQSGRRAAGNGSLMRTTPIGVAFARDGAQRIVEESLADSLLTHADPRCALACAIFNVAIAHGIEHPTGEALARGRAMLEAGRATLPVAVALLRDAWSDNPEDLEMVTRAAEDLQRDLDTGLSDNPSVYRVELDLQRTAGFVRVAFRLAFWHLTHTPWRAAVVDVASRGGDADTNGAIVGALLGARDGVLAIPGAWIDRVLGVEQPGPPEWATAHHPRHLVELVQHLRRSE
jgi:ADP-ribosylglycohydrolase